MGGVGVASCFAFLFAAPFILDAMSTKKWKRHWPTVDEYMARHGTRRGGLVCCYCGSGYIRHHGFKEPSDARRVHRCEKCMQYLYRSVG